MPFNAPEDPIEVDARWITFPEHVVRWIERWSIEQIAEELSGSVGSAISVAEAFGRIFLWSRGEHHGVDAFRERDPAQDDEAFDLLREFLEVPGRIFEDPGEGAKIYHQGALALIAAWRLTWGGVPTDADWNHALGELKAAYPTDKFTSAEAVQQRWNRLAKENPLLRLLDGTGHDLKTLRKRALHEGHVAEGFDLKKFRASYPWDSVTIYELRLVELWSELPPVTSSRLIGDFDKLDPYSAAIIVCYSDYGTPYVARMLTAMGYDLTDVRLEDVNQTLRNSLDWYG